MGFVYIFTRVLIALIRNMGAYPCPRCLIPMERIPNLGMAADVRQRLTLRRIDDIGCRTKIEQARKFIYAQGYAINGRVVDEILKDQSLVPTVVSLRSSSRISFDFNILVRILSPSNSIDSVSIFMICSW